MAIIMTVTMKAIPVKMRVGWTCRVEMKTMTPMNPATMAEMRSSSAGLSRSRNDVVAPPLVGCGRFRALIAVRFR